MARKYRECGVYKCHRKAVVEEVRRNDYEDNGKVFCVYHLIRRINQIIMTWSCESKDTIYFLPLDRGTK